VKRRYAHGVLVVDALGGIGFRGTCDCGWQGARKDTYAEARGELAWHRGEAHG
jgi:hypothetical protein